MKKRIVVLTGAGRSAELGLKPLEMQMDYGKASSVSCWIF